MLLHFIFVIKKDEQAKRKSEFEYVQQMALFYKSWIKKKFGMDFDVQCDIMITEPRSILQRIDTHTLLRDHEQRSQDTYHFYLCNFHPTWTDCTCEGYHAENFGMIWWQQPKNSDGVLFLAEKNCTAVSHEISHELLRVLGHKEFIQKVHEVWTRHFYDQLEFEQYGADFEKTDEEPLFLTIDTSSLNI